MARCRPIVDHSARCLTAPLRLGDRPLLPALAQVQALTLVRCRCFQVPGHLWATVAVVVPPLVLLLAVPPLVFRALRREQLTLTTTWC